MAPKKVTDATEQKGIEKHKKVQTAEGWKRSMMKMRAGKGKKASSKK